MNNKQLDKLIKAGEPGRWAIGEGLYFRIASSGKPRWEVRYSFDKKRKWFALPECYPALSISEAKKQAIDIKSKVKAGIDPQIEKKKAEQEVIRSVDDLFNDWFTTDISQRLKHPHIPKRIYTKEIAPVIGGLAISEVTPRDIRAIIHAVMNSGRPSIANDVLMYAKQLFRHGIKLDLVDSNPAQAFTMSDAGGLEKSRDRYLSLKELSIVFQVLRQYPAEFTRENYLACALLVCLGVRKGELIAAQWEEFDFTKQQWRIPENRSKTGVPLTIPLPNAVIAWLEELKMRSCGSEYVFPPRRASKSPHISEDTLNHALAKMFGLKVRPGRTPENILGKAGLEHFTLHDLRRTCRSLLAANGVPGHVAERCLNHKLKGVEGIYNRHDYLDERREALTMLASQVAPLVNGVSNVVTLLKAN
ncbi:integrase [Vibrio albus]|uniref:Integrase n=1 Tax=Vibrio albus TaxID=2200953 RepID=A0A2U3B8K5_9VIBR|nr:site-specific integrase [Vibrio albus]PWI33075.1 integrase [Vibrio albus]